MKIERTISEILEEVRKVLAEMDREQVNALVDVALSAKCVYVTGGGRTGLMARAFAMRLMQLGLVSYVVGETTTPSIGKEDLLIACSGSGRTQVTVLMSKVARRNGARVVAITADAHSPMAKNADAIIRLPAPTKYDQASTAGNGGETLPSSQYAGSLFEQSLLVLFDAMSAEIGRRLGLHPRDVSDRHANLE
ncbi:MAG: 6-phospho-3-hexuloisomerase [Phycisphaerae bacterium]|nr:6-phospho-3-hexuloisomerase [Phycisphaerae bacterium]